ncbi:MAG: ABC transporter permease [Saprospiraceae bacterium]|nr:ABC transporter permease [Saprospiraceae bacterium]
MLQNYFKIAIRSLLKNRLYSLINVLGLAIGLAAVIMILLYIQLQLNYDNFHANADEIYRVSIMTHHADAESEDSYVFTPPIGPAMKAEFPEVKNYTRISTSRPAYIAVGDKSLKVKEISYADSTFFDVFSFKVEVGNPQQMLAAPYSIVLTESTAQQLFGDEVPFGKTVKIDNQQTYQVSGVVADPPANSHLQFQALISFSTLFYEPNTYLDWNGGNQYITYVQLQESAAPESLQSKFSDFMWRHINESYANYGLRLEAYLQPLHDIHLKYNEYSKNLRTNLYIFGAVGLLILFIACVNFINLTTARAIWRTKEVGVRKVLGAYRKNLIAQFLGESFLLSFLGLLLAIIFAKVATPLYEQILGEDVHLASAFNWMTAVGILLILLLVGLVAGSYPAFYLSSLEAIQSLKHNQSGQKRQGIRNGLVVLQFTISIALIICTLVVNRQLDFTKRKSLGFDKENVLVLPLVGNDTQDKYATLKQELSRLPRVLGVAGSSEVPGGGFTSNGYVPEGMEQPMMINVVDIDEAFLKTFGLEMLQGRAFSEDRATDEEAFLVNETLAKTLGWNEPLGKIINRSGEHPIIGVVKDFNFATLHDKIAPLILTNKPWENRFSFLSLKIAPGSFADVMPSVEQAWREVLPQAPFDGWFLDESIHQLYQSEQRFQTLFLYFSALSIFIALLGILGLATFVIEQRTKEIGIRKVLGADVGSIVTLLSKDFLKLVLIAALISFPIAWWLMNQWLTDFAYRITLEWWMFAIAGVAAILTALFTVGIKAIQAANANPVASLRSE